MRMLRRYPDGLSKFFRTEYGLIWSRSPTRRRAEVGRIAIDNPAVSSNWEDSSTTARLQNINNLEFSLVNENNIEKIYT